MLTDPRICRWCGETRSGWSACDFCSELMCYGCEIRQYFLAKGIPEGKVVCPNCVYAILSRRRNHGVTSEDEKRQEASEQDYGEQTGSIRDTIKWFSDVMKDRMMANLDKGGWRQCADSYLLARLRDEVHELDAALQCGEFEAIAHEAADVANFAMMLADPFRKG